jgi:uncharacterized protein
MLLTPERPSDDLRYIRSYTREGFLVGSEHHRGSLLVSAVGVAPWGCDLGREPPQWAEADLLKLEGELLIVGTGTLPRFLPHALHLLLLERFGGVEVMTTEAACRTYDVIVLEGRRVVAALACVETPSPAHGG